MEYSLFRTIRNICWKISVTLIRGCFSSVKYLTVEKYVHETIKSVALLK